MMYKFIREIILSLNVTTYIWKLEMIEEWLRWLIDIDQSNRVIVKFQADLFLKLVSIYSFELLTSRIFRIS